MHFQAEEASSPKAMYLKQNRVTREKGMPESTVEMRLESQSRDRDRQLRTLVPFINKKLLKETYGRQYD